MQQQGVSSIQFMGMLMSRQTLQISLVLELVESLNTSYFSCQHIITILEQIFSREKSNKILLSVEILEYLVKNCNKNFHQAANKLSFQKSLLPLLRRVRGKTSFLKQIRSNSNNWAKIQAKILYLIQLWYDAFILEQNVYDNIIGTYKQLRKQNILFPPRSANQKNLLFVQTQSPILDNIQEIARHDHQKFSKKLTGMGFGKVSEKMELIQAEEQRKKLTRKIDIDELSERIAIVRSNEYEGVEMLMLIEEIKKDLEYGVVDTSEEKYWKDLKEAGESLIQEWELKNAQLIKQHQKQYLQKKLGKMTVKEIQKEQSKDHKEEEEQFQWNSQNKQEGTKKHQLNLLDL